MSISGGMGAVERRAFIRETFSKARNDKESISLLKYHVLVARSVGAIPVELGLRIIKGLTKIDKKR